MKIRKFFAGIVSAALSFGVLTGCSDSANSDGTADAETTAASEVHDMTAETSYSADYEHVKGLGRTYFNEDKLYCALSGSGAEFSFTGTKCTVVIAGDSTATGTDNQARVGIYVNGERVVDDMVDNIRESYDVFESDTAQDVTVSIVKLSESPMSTFGVDSLLVTGTEPAPTPDKDLYIEFIGDSITCGYGVDDPDRDHHFATNTEDVTKAYAYKTARALDADYSMVSFSGYGIISGYSDGTTKVENQTVPQYYTKLGYCWSQNGSFDPENTEWNFERQPDVIVVNLGTNDDSYTKSDGDRQMEFAAAYADFLKLIREKNPDAKILCTLGIMGDNLYPYIEYAVQTYTEETGDANVYTMKFDVQSPDDGYSADWHPSVTTHDKAAEKLTAEIKTLLG